MKTRTTFLWVTAILALVSCTENTYLGDPSGTIEGNGAILFSSNTPQVTRTTAADAAKLNYQFKVFGVKTVSSSDQRVFATAPSGVKPYWVWFVDNTASTTTSNSSNWEYVGTSGQTYGTTDHQVSLTADQTIKYWDFSASAYNFQAWSDVNAAAADMVTAITKNTMTISGTPAQLANLYISDLQTGAPASFTNHVVQFTFRKAATKVRLGIYETVPGYHVRNMKFYYTPKDGTETSSEADASEASNATLTGKFIGESNPAAATSFDVTYEAATPHKAVIKPSSTETSAKTEHFAFGTIGTNNTTYLGETATSPTWAGGSADYTSVFPNTDSENIANMTLKVDYELYNEVSREVIAVKGKIATVPAAYMTWRPNYAYTYLFKITDDQLTPITLDAVVIDDGEGHQETITTIPNDGTTVSITTFGYDATNKKYIHDEAEYETGNDIYATFMDGATVPQLTEATKANLVKVYFVDYKAGASDQQKADHPITETSVADAIAENAAGALITFTDITTDGTTKFTAAPEVVNTIPAENGVSTKTIDALHLTGVKAAGKYAVEITTYKAVPLSAGAALAGYYSVSSDEYTKLTEGEYASGTYYEQIKTYKVITVVAP